MLLLRALGLIQLVLATGVYETKNQETQLLLYYVVLARGVYEAEYQQNKLLLRDLGLLLSVLAMVEQDDLASTSRSSSCYVPSASYNSSLPQVCTSRPGFCYNILASYYLSLPQVGVILRYKKTR